MDISVVLLLGWASRDKIADSVIDQVSDGIQNDWSIFPNQTCRFFVSIIVLGHFKSPGCPLSLIGGKWGESRSQHTLEYIWYAHQQEGEHRSWNSFSLMNLTLQRRVCSATKKEHNGGSWQEPASSLSNGIDNVPHECHLNTFLTHRKKIKWVQLIKWASIPCCTLFPKQRLP